MAGRAVRGVALALAHPPCPLLLRTCPTEDLLSEAVHSAYLQRLVQPNDYGGWGGWGGGGEWG